MPVIKQLYPTNNSVVCIWKIEEDLEKLERRLDLCSSDLVAYSGFTVDKRKKEWLISRIMLRQTLGTTAQILYDESRNPSIKDSKYNISISHCKDYVAIYLDATEYIGIDIELFRENIKKIANKFLSKIELEQIPIDNPISKLTACWCIKETMYKYYSNKQLDFKKHLSIDAFNLALNGTVWTSILKKGYKKVFPVNYIIEKDHCFAFASGNS